MKWCRTAQRQLKKKPKWICWKLTLLRELDDSHAWIGIHSHFSFVLKTHNIFSFLLVCNFFSFVRFLRFVFVFHLVCMQLCDLRSTNFNSYTCNVVNRTNSFDSFYANTHFYNERKKWTKKILLAFFFHCIFVCHGWLTLCLGSFTSLYLFER